MKFYSVTLVVKKAKVEDPDKVTEGAIKRAEYKKMVEYLDGRFTPDNLTFESVESLANEEGIDGGAYVCYR